MTAPASRRHFVKTAVAAAVTAPYIARGAASAGFEIGLVADAQYADVEPTKTRFYRDSLARLNEAVAHFERRDLAFCVHLGDLIDRDWRSFAAIQAPLASSRHRWHHVLGNHDFDMADAEKPRVPAQLGIPQRYRFFEHSGFRFVLLDTNDVSTYAHPAGSPERAAAEKELARITAAKLVQAKSWNGGIGPAQLAWFERTCAEARAAGQRVIVLAHQPVYPENQHNIWNDAEVLAAIDRQPNVVAWLNGHNHDGNFGERHGIPFVNFRGMVETPGPNAFATAQILPDRLLLTGHGREPSRELKFRV